MSLVFDHAGIVTGDVEAAAAQLAKLLMLRETSQRCDDSVLGVSVLFVRDAGGVTYEMIAPFGAKSPVAATLAKERNRLNQLAYRCADLAAAAAAMRSGGAVPLGPARPALAFSGAKVQFFWMPLGFVAELIEGEGDARVYRPAGL